GARGRRGDRVVAAVAVAPVGVDRGAGARDLLVDDHGVVDVVGAGEGQAAVHRQRALAVLGAEVQVMGGGVLLHAPGAGGGVRIPVVGAAELGGGRAGGLDRADHAIRGVAVAALGRQHHIG